MEILVAGAIGGVMLAGSMKTLQLSLQSAQVVKSSLSESDLHHTIRQVLSSKQDCLSNFKPTGETIPSDPKQPSSIGLYGADREWGVGEVVRFAKTFGNTDNTDDEALLKKGVAFKGDLSIVKMELKGDLPTTPPPPDDDKITKKEATRHFIVYYKKRGLGSYSTVGGADCKANNLSGCYFNRCVLTLKLEPNPPDTKEEKCESTCTAVSGGGGGSGNPDCYKVDDSKTLVGCGKTKDIATENTTAIGLNAGQALPTGSGNTFLGAGAGYKTTTGQSNIFIGFGAGQDNTEGSDNTFIGTNPVQGTVSTGDNNIAIGSGVKVEFPNNDNQINIGNIIKANRDTDPEDNTKKMGVLKICNPGGTDGDGKCIELSKKSLACPANHYFRGIYQEDTPVGGELKKKGEPICQPERCTPQGEEPSVYFWIPENQCHNCPRASPHYIPANPPSSRCFNCRYGPSSYDLKTNTCHDCFSPKLYYYDGKCNHCPKGGDSHWDGSICVTCFGGKVWDSDTKTCKCPPNTHFYDLVCNKCRRGAHWDGSTCVTCDSGAHWDGSTCVTCDSGAHWDGSSCITCTGSNPYWTGSTCVTCPSNQRWDSFALACVSCSGGGAYWQTSGSGYWCQCPPGDKRRKKSGSVLSCECPEDRPYFYIGRATINIFPTSSPRWACHKCPKTKPALSYGGTCYPCKDGYFNSSGWQNCACNDSTHYWHGTEMKCKPCGSPAQIRGGGTVVTSYWTCDYRCLSSSYPVYRDGKCCPENGDCCLSGDYLEGGRCKRRIGNKIWSCPAGQFISADASQCCSLHWKTFTTDPSDPEWQCQILIQ